MLKEDNLTANQQAAIDRIYNENATILIAATGAGKTAICLTAISDLIKAGELRRVIVACPARVVHVWAAEAVKWSHLHGLKVARLQGNREERTKRIVAHSNILVVSLNNLAWLLEQKHGCDGIVIDELSKASGVQTKGLRSKKKADVLKWRVGMTATPVSQDFEKLYAMARIIDHGASLGTSKDRYLNDYFYSDYNGYNWTLREEGAAAIMNKVGGLIHAVTDTKEEDLPALTYVEHRFDMPPESRVLYDKMKKDMVVKNVEAANEAVKSGKLRQIASGFLYGDEKNQTVIFTLFDTARTQALRDILNESAAKKTIIFYEYTAQLVALTSVLPFTTESVEEFIDATVPTILLAQINALSHGIDGLQYACHDVIMYHPMWSRDATEQAVGRVWRQGQERNVTVTTIVCRDTLDDLVLQRVEDRGKFMQMFMKHLKGREK